MCLCVSVKTASTADSHLYLIKPVCRNPLTLPSLFHHSALYFSSQILYLEDENITCQLIFQWTSWEPCGLFTWRREERKESGSSVSGFPLNRWIIQNLYANVISMVKKLREEEPYFQVAFSARAYTVCVQLHLNGYIHINRVYTCNYPSEYWRH